MSEDNTRAIAANNWWWVQICCVKLGKDVWPVQVSRAVVVSAQDGQMPERADVADEQQRRRGEGISVDEQAKYASMSHFLPHTGRLCSRVHDAVRRSKWHAGRRHRTTRQMSGPQRPDGLAVGSSVA